MPKIKPCKCGYSAVIELDYAPLFTTFYIECTRPFCGLRTKEYKSEKKAIKAWNKKYENIRTDKSAG